MRVHGKSITRDIIQIRSVKISKDGNLSSHKWSPSRSCIHLQPHRSTCRSSPAIRAPSRILQIAKQHFRRKEMREDHITRTNLRCCFRELGDGNGLASASAEIRAWNVTNMRRSMQEILVELSMFLFC